MASVEELLGRYLRGYDVAAAGAALGPELARTLVEHHPGMELYRAPLEEWLAEATIAGVTRFIDTAELRLSVEGQGPDPTMGALDQAIDTVRLAVGMIAQAGNEEPRIGPAASQRIIVEALKMLQGLVAAWDAAK